MSARNGRRASGPAPGTGRHQRGHPIPQVVRNKISTRSGHPADQDRRAYDPQLNSFSNDQLVAFRIHPGRGHQG
ncbi:hypothetical protein DEJ50_33675 [Streptomyces venezuelae]|uniref:Uncharacterized protein n=1 Tax=Streptomyces venezuelae TaxID=54571 RepID=A0A5P2DA47_STRVZ|nr:hypothetical protein DEJ50_33675 [Streptomyces venezuelae]